jgi:hypothetical protein
MLAFKTAELAFGRTGAYFFLNLRAVAKEIRPVSSNSMDFFNSSKDVMWQSKMCGDEKHVDVGTILFN